MSDNVQFSIQNSPDALSVSVAGVPRLVFEALGNGSGSTVLRDAVGRARIQFSNTEDGYGTTTIFDASGIARFEAPTETGEAGGTKIRDDEGNAFQFVRGLTVQKVFLVADLPDAGLVGRGARSVVIDAAHPCPLKAVVGGGELTAPVYSDGVVWRIG